MRSHHPKDLSALEIFRHYLGDIVYGGNDGIITTFTVVSGVAGAHLSPVIIVVIGIINLLGDGFSMGASNYLAIRADATAHGHDRGVLEPLIHSVMTFLAFVLLGAIPLIGFATPWSINWQYGISTVLTGITLFVMGALSGKVTDRHWFRCGLEMFAVGACAAVVAYGTGYGIHLWMVG